MSLFTPPLPCSAIVYINRVWRGGFGLYMSRERPYLCAHVPRVNTCGVGCSKEEKEKASSKESGEMQPKMTRKGRIRMHAWERFVSTLGGQL